MNRDWIHDFSLNYISEVSIRIKVAREEGELIFDVRHPYDWPESIYYNGEHRRVGLQGSWFHFEGWGPDDIVVVEPIDGDEREAIFAALAKIEEVLAPGVEWLIEDQDDRNHDPRAVFHNDLLYAFIGGRAGHGFDIPKERWLD